MISGVVNNKQKRRKEYDQTNLPVRLQQVEHLGLVLAFFELVEPGWLGSPGNRKNLLFTLRQYSATWSLSVVHVHNSNYNQLQNLITNLFSWSPFGPPLDNLFQLDMIKEIK